MYTRYKQEYPQSMGFNSDNQRYLEMVKKNIFSLQLAVTVQLDFIKMAKILIYH